MSGVVGADMARAGKRTSPRPLHPPLTDFPVALWSTSLIFDLLSLWLGNALVMAAFYNIAAGSVFALAAALTGALDYNRIPDDSPARRVGLLHGGLNIVAFTLFAVNLWMRATQLNAITTPTAPVVLSAIGVAIVGISAWLGGHMVYDYGIGTEKEALRRGRDVPGGSREPLRP